MVPLAPIFKRAYWSLVVAGALYALLILSLTNPFLQRQALYAHKLHSAWWFDITKSESFGFAKNQIAPLNISTPDGERLFAWHILPLGLYAKHEDEILAASATNGQDYTRSTGFKLLTEDPNSRLIINFHGNAGHVAEGWRTDAYRGVSSGASTTLHVLTFDYRGFGYSTGSPDEAGLIADGIAVVNWALNVARLPPSRIVLLGQSLGTAVASAVALHFAAGPDVPKNLPKDLAAQRPARPVDFAGVALVAAFRSLPTLLETYRMAGIIPLMSPLRPYPFLQKFLADKVVDTWDTEARLVELVKLSQGRRLKLQLLHAKNDYDVAWRNSEGLFKSVVEAAGGVVHKRVIGKGEGYIETWDGKDGRDVRLDVLAHGGHNRLVTHAPVALAVLRAFDFSREDAPSES